MYLWAFVKKKMLVVQASYQNKCKELRVGFRRPKRTVTVPCLPRLSLMREL